MNIDVVFVNEYMFSCKYILYVCCINCCAKQRVSKENCVMSFEIVDSVLRHGYKQL